jgi:hypothetical protein
MQNTVYCLASTEPHANSILTGLGNLGFPPSDISVVLPNKSADTKNIAVEEDAIHGARTGGVVGGVLGLVAGFVALALPGVGAILVAGPLVSALGGAVAGGVVGGLAGGTGAVHPLGLPKDVSGRIEDRLRVGDVMISVQSTDPDVLLQAENFFKSSGAGYVYYHDSEKSA